jgi:hypothetical protein
VLNFFLELKPHDSLEVFTIHPTTLLTECSGRFPLGLDRFLNLPLNVFFKSSVASSSLRLALSHPALHAAEFREFRMQLRFLETQEKRQTMLLTARLGDGSTRLLSNNVIRALGLSDDHLGLSVSPHLHCRHFVAGLSQITLEGSIRLICHSQLRGSNCLVATDFRLALQEALLLP